MMGETEVSRLSGYSGEGYLEPCKWWQLASLAPLLGCRSAQAFIEHEYAAFLYVLVLTW